MVGLNKEDEADKKIGRASLLGELNRKNDLEMFEIILILPRQLPIVLHLTHCQPVQLKYLLVDS